MTICPVCRAEQMNGTLFCSECGNDLLTPALPTYDLPENKPSASPEPPQPVLRQVRAPTANSGPGQSGNASGGMVKPIKPVQPFSKPEAGQIYGDPVYNRPAPPPPPMPVAPPVPNPAKATPPVPGPAPANPPAGQHGFRLLVLNTGRVLDCPEKDKVIIGRADAITGDQPDIDLTADNALELGVSRRHACITFTDSVPYLTDLGSTNRTFLNRQIMMRGQPYELQDGDEIRLGNVIMKIIFNSGSFGLMR